MRVEVQHRDRAVPFGDDAQQRQGDRVVAADHDEALAVGGEVGRRGLDLLDGLGEVERVGRDVTGVDDLLAGEWLNILHRVVGAEQPGGLAHVRRAEAGAGAVADPGVERNADHGDVGARHVFEAGEPGEGGDPGVARHDAGIDGTDGRVSIDHGGSLLLRRTM